MTEAVQFTPTPSGPDLVDLVRRYRMTWRTQPELAMHDGQLMPIGFTVQIIARYAHPAHPPLPDCPECAPVRRALRLVADAVVPKGEHVAWYNVQVLEAVQYDGARDPALSATITVLHKGRENRPPDDLEIACVTEIRENLQELGVVESD